MDELKKLAEHHRLIPLQSGAKGKQPRDKGYSGRDYTFDEITGNIATGNNVGMMIGKGEVDVDLDWPEAQIIWHSFVAQKKSLQWGRHDRITHHVYRCDLGKPMNFELPNVPGAPEMKGAHGRMILQLRTSTDGEPYHVMIPPSVHPDGDKLEGLVSPLEDLAVEDLLLTAEVTAGLSALARFYPSQGNRDEVMLGLVGIMVRGGWDQKRIETWAQRFCRMVRDDEVEMRVAKAQQAFKRLAAGKTLRGIPATAKLLGIPVEWMTEIAIWMGWRQRNPEGKGAAVFLSAVVKDVAKQAWDALAEYEIDGDPAVYAFGEALSRVDDGRLQMLSPDGLKHELNRCAAWLAEDNGKWKRSSAPTAVVSDMLTARRRDVTVPTLNRVSIVPTFTKDGRLLSEAGFDEKSGIFLDLKVDVDVPERPTRQQVRTALRQLWFPISQFPFVEKSDKVHALAMILEPYMRDMFGPTPFHFINKPEAGTGASLFIETALYPTLGQWPDAQTAPKSSDEMKKTLTACLAEGVRCIYFDNANVLNSAELASALTAETYAARILGVSKMLRVPVQVQWVGSGNNTELTTELYRRVNDIRMDAQVERPEDRNIGQFRIKDLKEWTVEHQAQQVQAALTIIQYWVNLGMPKGQGSKASYEAWAAKLSGLFDAINVRGFLTTPKDRRPEDPDAETMRELILAMFNAHRGKIQPSNSPAVWKKPVQAKDVVDLIRAQNIAVDFGFNEEARAVSKLLGRYVGRPFAFEATTGRVFSLKLAKSSYQGTTRWIVVADVVGEATKDIGHDELPQDDGVPF